MLEEGTRFGEFRLLRRLGSGGAGEVFLARREGPQGFEKQLVVKRLLHHLAGVAHFTEKFLREARYAALIDHPNLVHVSGFGEVDGSYYLAMEYVDGLNIDALLARVGTLSPGVAFRVVIDVLDALHAVHTVRHLDGRPLNLVHRSVTPSNVMLTRTGAAKVLDLGMAVPQHSTAHRAGNRRFMSPEQARGDAVDARSDLYCVGLLLSLMLTGRHPHSDEAEADAQPALPAADVVLDLLQEAPERRPTSAREVQAVLEELAVAQGYDGTRAHVSELVAEVLRPEEGASEAADILMEPLRAQGPDTVELEAQPQDDTAIGPPPQFEEEGVPVSDDPEIMEAEPPTLPRPFGEGLRHVETSDVGLMVGTSGVAASAPEALVQPTSLSDADEDVEGSPTLLGASALTPLEEIASSPETSSPEEARGTVPMLFNGPLPRIEPIDAQDTSPLPRPQPPRRSPWPGRILLVGGVLGMAAFGYALAGGWHRWNEPVVTPVPPLVPPPVSVEASPDRKPGFLEVDVHPRAEVFVDDEPVGWTPVLGLTLPPGNRSVRLINRERAVDIKLSVTITSGEVTKIDTTLSTPPEP